MKLHSTIYSLAAIALLTACGGPQIQPAMQPQSQAGAPGARPYSSPGDLLYVSDQERAKVYVYRYPAGQLAATLTGLQFPESLCVDQSGNVYVADQGGQKIAEFAHGGTSPIKTWADKEYPVACSVDPVTGDLAAANELGTVSVYKNGTGSPAIYTTPFVPWFCAYDTFGNLFADSDGAGVQIAELPKGGDAFEQVTYHEGNNGVVAGMQWVGNHLAVGTASRYSGHCCGRIHRFSIKGRHGRRAGSMFVPGQMNNFFIYGSTAIVTTGTHRVLFYDYPKGGGAKLIVKEPGSASYSAVVSPAASGVTPRR